MSKMKVLLAASAITVVGAAGANAATLDDIKSKGFIQCGVSTGVPGFSYTDEDGNWQGFDPAVCQAVAAAVFGDPSKVRYTPTTGKTRFTALASGEIDMLARNTTWTLTRDVDLGFTFVGVNYYDGQGFMVPKALGVDSAHQLDGASVCIQTGTTTELNLADFFRLNDMSYEPVPIETQEEAISNYTAGRCDTYTTDSSGLAAARSSFENPKDHVILPEIISKEPLGPLVREGDEPWGDIVRWTLNAMIAAEEFGVNSENVDDQVANSEHPEVRRLLGVEGNMGEILGLDSKWGYNIIKMVGNYGEVFERYIGTDTPVGLERGLNAQYKNGGILYAPPIR